MAKECECLKWRRNIKKITALVIMGDHEGLNVDDITFFKYCPWCGKKLKENWDMVGAYG